MSKLQELNNKLKAIEDYKITVELDQHERYIEYDHQYNGGKSELRVRMVQDGVKIEDFQNGIDFALDEKAAIRLMETLEMYLK